MKRVWLFDPQSITHQPQRCWWNPLRGMDTVEDADRLAAAFIVTVDDPKKTEIWGPAAKELLSGLSCWRPRTSGKTMVEVYTWLADGIQRAGAAFSDAVGHRRARGVGRRHQQPPGDTKGGVYFTARTAVQRAAGRRHHPLDHPAQRPCGRGADPRAMSRPPGRLCICCPRTAAARPPRWSPP